MAQLFDFAKMQMMMNQKDPVFGFVILTVMETLSSFFKEFGIFVKKYITDYFNSKCKSVNLVTQFVTNINQIEFERNYEKSGKWDSADAILFKVMNVPDSQKLLVIGQLEIIKNGKEFNINNSIKFQMTELEVADSTIKQIKFRIFSETLTTCDLRNWVSDITEEFLVNKKNNLGHKLYFFDHISEKAKTQGDIQRKLVFSQHLFSTNRNLDNVFHEKREELTHRVNFFLKNKEWYDQRGIPHTLGLLFYGTPGTGKTSSIKAIAKESNRHIINVNLSTIKCKKQLKKLFYDERIDICPNPENPFQTVEYIIPIDRRIYIMEDIDAVEGDLLLKRSGIETNGMSEITKPPKENTNEVSEEMNEEQPITPIENTNNEQPITPIENNTNEEQPNNFNLLNAVRELQPNLNDLNSNLFIVPNEDSEIIEKEYNISKEEVSDNLYKWSLLEDFSQLPQHITEIILKFRINNRITPDLTTIHRHFNTINKSQIIQQIKKYAWNCSGELPTDVQRAVNSYSQIINTNIDNTEYSKTDLEIINKHFKTSPESSISFIKSFSSDSTDETTNRRLPLEVQQIVNKYKNTDSGLSPNGITVCNEDEIIYDLPNSGDYELMQNTEYSNKDLEIMEKYYNVDRKTAIIFLQSMISGTDNIKIDQTPEIQEIVNRYKLHKISRNLSPEQRNEYLNKEVYSSETKQLIETVENIKPIDYQNIQYSDKDLEIIQKHYNFNRENAIIILDKAMTTDRSSYNTEPQVQNIINKYKNLIYSPNCSPEQEKQIRKQINKGIEIKEYNFNSKKLSNINYGELEKKFKQQPKKLKFTNDSIDDSEATDIDLSTILNIIDGTLETPGRILIISSNFPEKLDDALIRPGRIDMIINFKKANRQIVKEMFHSFYGIDPQQSKIDKIQDYKWSPAEVSQILFKNFDKPEKSLEDLVKLNPQSLFRF